MNRYFSVDCEFSGLNHTKYDLISIGIVEVEKIDGKFKTNKLKKFYIELKPQKNTFEPEAMKINGLNFNNLRTYGHEPKEACRQILHYLDLQEDDTAIFIGYCSTLDKIYIDQLFYLAEMENPFNYEVIEISSLAIGRLNLEWGFSEKQLEETINLQPMDKFEKHNALQDAIHQAEEFCLIINK